MNRILIIFLLFFLSFIILPFGVSPFEIPKVICAEIVIDILLITFLLTARVFSFTKHIYILVGIILLTFIDLIFFKTSISFFGNAYRLQGIFLLWHLIVFAWLSSQINIKNSSYLFPVIAFSLLFISTFVFGTNQAARFVGALGEPNSLAGVVIFLWPFIYFVPKEYLSKQIIIRIICFISMGIILILSGSRSGLIAFGIQAIFLLMNKFKFSIKKSVIICLILLICSYLLPFVDRGKLREDRFEIWQTAVVAGWQHPILGGGFGNTEKLINQGALQLGNSIRFQFVDSSHNIFLDWWVTGGIVGFLLLLMLLKQAFASFIFSKNINMIVLLLGVLTILSFNPVSVVILIQFWWLIGQGFSPAFKQV